MKRKEKNSLYGLISCPENLKESSIPKWRISRSFILEFDVKWTPQISFENTQNYLKLRQMIEQLFQNPLINLNWRILHKNSPKFKKNAFENAQIDPKLRQMIEQLF